MKRIIFKVMIITTFIGLTGCKDSDDPGSWNRKKLNEWFKKGDWLNGWQVNPDPSINTMEFAVSYFKNKERWDKAFTFLKSNDLKIIEPEKYVIDGSDVYATVSEYMTKDEEDARFEAHLKYADIQYVIDGRELIGLAPLDKKKDIIENYNEANDIIFLTVNSFKNLEATPEKFFIFLPDDIHRPGLKDGDSKMVRKIVIKVRIN